MKHFLTFFLAVAFLAVCFAYPTAESEEESGAPRQQRQAGGGDHHDVVDFGAHTGDHGAFGWYADFPVHSHAD
ncbi:unnamed protein product [Ceutorhynchus assimilis]|uniref:Uncharacterized protein n=1 Tax=Ceutorhynchus assimilis TaxID=467358 RepID=A0A9N9QEN1_9CUCU|nr:unnamed protein product [Ceutorhynchus assimilis]